MKLTGAIVLLTAILLGLYDIYTGMAHGGETTISWVVYDYSTKFPVIPFGFGFLMGHVFASMRGIPYEKDKG